MAGAKNTRGLTSLPPFFGSPVSTTSVSNSVPILGIGP